MVVVAYGQILTTEILESPRLGCLNVHGSLLPRWRGAAPLQRCIEAGDSVTGVTIILMDEGLDTGPMLAKVSTAITDRTTATELHDQLAKLGAPLLVGTLKQLADSNHQLVQQPAEGITYAKKISTQHACIQWGQKAIQRDATDPCLQSYPGCIYLRRVITNQNFFCTKSTRVSTCRRLAVEGKSKKSSSAQTPETWKCLNVSYQEVTV